ncbi:MAG: hypothetical protein P8J87_21155 [Verrucomicrobiales bacterium]|nr:hypothetical protein [Verrucomicrobiales bacterium]
MAGNLVKERMNVMRQVVMNWRPVCWISQWFEGLSITDIEKSLRSVMNSKHCLGASSEPSDEAWKCNKPHTATTNFTTLSESVVVHQVMIRAKLTCSALELEADYFVGFVE